MLTFLIGSLSYSHHLSRDPRQSDESYEAEGRLVLFQFVPGDKFARIYLAGKEAAKVNFDSKSKLVSVTLFQKGKKQSVPFKSMENYYQLETVPHADPYELEMEATVDGKPDKVRMTIKKP